MIFSEATFGILFIALISDRIWGEPKILWNNIPHPVVLFGKAIGFVDKHFNLTSDDNDTQYKKGALSISILIIFAICFGLLLDFCFSYLGLAGSFMEGVIVFVLLAQKSLFEHVNAVVKGLRNKGLKGGRIAVGMIVGRDPEMLDRAGISRASIETLAENYSDGVVAPAFWYLVFGLPGILAYKIINTADSMLGYHSERYEYFGKVTAQIDDLANWLPARLSALLICGGALIANGIKSANNAISCVLQNAGLHRSPNAGWPESAMAGACNFALGGPRKYPSGTVQQVFINGSGKLKLDADDIDQALKIAKTSGGLLIAIIGFMVLIF